MYTGLKYLSVRWHLLCKDRQVIHCLWLMSLAKALQSWMVWPCWRPALTTCCSGATIVRWCSSRLTSTVSPTSWPRVIHRCCTNRLVFSFAFCAGELRALISWKLLREMDQCRRTRFLYTFASVQTKARAKCWRFSSQALVKALRGDSHSLEVPLSMFDCIQQHQKHYFEV